VEEAPNEVEEAEADIVVDDDDAEDTEDASGDAWATAETEAESRF